jgi:hypothetical protein
MPRKRKHELHPSSVCCIDCGQAFPFRFWTALVPDFAERGPMHLRVGQANATGAVVQAHTRYGGDRGPVCVRLDPPETVTIRPEAALAQVMAESAWGWSFDGKRWRARPENQAQWAWACEVARRPDAYTVADVQRARDGLARGSFPYNDPGRVVIRFLGAHPDWVRETLERFALPTEIECIRCGTANLVLPDLTRRRVVE